MSNLEGLSRDALKARIASLRFALRESNSLFAAMLLEKRPDTEIEAQITNNNRALSSTQRETP